MLTIRKGGHRDLERYYGLMEIDFDSEELLGKLAIHRAISRGEQELLIVYDDETNLEVAYALCGVKSLYGYVLLKYMAVFPWYRGKGLGIQTMRLLNKRYADRQGIIAELTEFDDPEPDHLKKTASPVRRRTSLSSPSSGRRTSRRSITACSRIFTAASSRPWP